jgi:hypothetical protein
MFAIPTIVRGLGAPPERLPVEDPARNDAHLHPTSILVSFEMNDIRGRRILRRQFDIQRAGVQLHARVLFVQTSTIRSSGRSRRDRSLPCLATGHILRMPKRPRDSIKEAHSRTESHRALIRNHNFIP